MIFADGRIGGDDIRAGMIGHHILAHLHLHRQDRGHGLGIVEIDGRELFDKGKHSIELLRKMGQFIITNRNAGQLSDAADIGLINRHWNSKDQHVSHAYSIHCAQDAMDGRRLATLRRSCYRPAMSANLLTLDQLHARLSRHARLIGIDLGTKTIGLALSDVERRIATPLETIQRVKFTQDAQRLIELARKHGVEAFVMGLPLNMDGSEGPRVQSTKAFLNNLARLTDLPSVFWDERLSTAFVQRSLIEQDVSRAKRAEIVDRMAAAYILQGALDRLARLSQDGQGTAHASE